MVRTRGGEVVGIRTAQGSLPALIRAQGGLPALIRAHEIAWRRPGKHPTLHTTCMRRLVESMEALPLVRLHGAGVDELPPRPSFSTTPYVSDVRFDRDGELLASCSTSGVLTLHTLDQLACAKGGSFGLAPPPAFVVRTGHKSSALRWSVRDDNQIACAFSSVGEVQLYDIAALSTSPSRRLKAPPGCQGLTDVEYLHAHHGIAAGGSDGRLHLWDERAGSRPVQLRQGLFEAQANEGPITSIASSADGALVLAATKSGKLLVWDVRHGAAARAHVRTCNSATHKGCIESIALCDVRARVGASAVLAQLGTGELSVLDYESGAQRTLPHRAAAAAEPGGGASAGWLPAWAPQWAISRRKPALAADGCGPAHVWMPAGALHGGGLLACVSLELGARPWSHTVRLHAPPVAIARHARTQLVAAGCADNSIVLLRPAPGASVRAYEEACRAAAERAAEAEVGAATALVAKPAAGAVRSAPQSQPQPPGRAAPALAARAAPQPAPIATARAPPGAGAEASADASSTAAPVSASAQMRVGQHAHAPPATNGAGGAEGTAARADSDCAAREPPADATVAQPARPPPRAAPKARTLRDFFTAQPAPLFAAARQGAPSGPKRPRTEPRSGM